MYSLSQVRRALDTPALFFREANRLYHRRLSAWDYNKRGTAVLDEDWDTLVILDGCRYDVFEQCVGMEGDLSSRISRGSNTVEFLRGNLADRTVNDTVYVTANPQLYRHRDDINATFYDVVDVWDSEGWDGGHGTVLPETVARYGKEALAEHDDKRIIVHFVQPHYPFIGAETDFDKGHLETEDDGELNPWDRIMQDRVSVDRERIWELYRDNLQRCLPHVRDLVDATPYKTVVTADHGNMFGDRALPFPIREWGHPRGLYTEQLVKVPWFTPPYEERKAVTEGSTRGGQTTAASTTVEGRLRDLGYR
jgi:hypothetical protein